MTQRRGRLFCTFRDGETDDGTVAEGTFYEDPASGIVSLRIGNWKTIPANRKTTKKGLATTIPRRMPSGASSQNSGQVSMCSSAWSTTTSRRPPHPNPNHLHHLYQQVAFFIQNQLHHVHRYHHLYSKQHHLDLLLPHHRGQDQDHFIRDKDQLLLELHYHRVTVKHDYFLQLTLLFKLL